MVNYPAQIDNSISLPSVVDNVTPITGAIFNRLRDTILQVQTELGIKPSGTFTTVRNRLDSLEALSGNTELDASVITLIGIDPPPLSPSGFSRIYFDKNTNTLKISENGGSYEDLIFFAGGDLSGSPTHQTVIGLQGKSISSVSPSNGNVLTWVSVNNQWEPQPAAVSFLANGDLSGSAINQTVIGLQTVPVSTSTPLSNNALVFDGTDWAPTQLTLDPELIGPAFAISLSGGTLAEVGQTVNTPSFTSTKNYTGTAAVLTNTDNSESKNVLAEFNSNSPFTSAFSYVKNTYGAVVTFILTANKGAIVRTANTNYTWAQKVFYGATTPGTYNEAFVEGLASNALATSTARTITLNITAGEYGYFAYRSAYSTPNFIDQSTGFAVDMTFISNSISVTNTYGFTENYTLYRTTNTNLGSLTMVIS